MLEPVSSRNHSLQVKNLAPGLTEVGKIKIGLKGQERESRGGKTFQPPQKLDYFLVTTLQRGVDGNFLTDQRVHKLFGEKPRELPVYLVYNDPALNFQSRYVAFKGKTLWCSGDGEKAFRLKANGPEREERPCPCHLQNPEYQGTDPPRCKINGTLSCIIQGIDSIGGVWKLRTTSYNTVVGIMSSLHLLSRLTGGPIAGLPLTLTLQPKTVIVPTNGQSMLVYVVAVEFRGSIDALRQKALEGAKRETLYLARIESLEEQARKLLTAEPVVSEAEISEVVDEFFPEQHAASPKAEVLEGEFTEGASPAAPLHDAGKPEEAGSVAPPAKETRRCRNTFTSLDPEHFKGGEVKTCGITPADLLQLRALSKLPENRSKIEAKLKEIGYGELRYLRTEEAGQLIASCEPLPLAEESQGEQPADENPPQEGGIDAPADLIDCPQMGGKVSKGGYCLTDCATRKADGFCPLLGESAPGQKMLF